MRHSCRRGNGNPNHSPDHSPLTFHPHPHPNPHPRPNPNPNRPQDAAVTALGYDVLFQLGYANQSSYWLPGHSAGRLCWLDMPCVGVHDLSVLAIWAVGGVLSCFLLLRFCVRDPH